jgi:hypothetical protein
MTVTATSGGLMDVACRLETLEVNATVTEPDRNEVVYSWVRGPSKALGDDSDVRAVERWIDFTLIDCKSC